MISRNNAGGNGCVCWEGREKPGDHILFHRPACGWGGGGVRRGTERGWWFLRGGARGEETRPGLQVRSQREPRQIPFASATFQATPRSLQLEWVLIPKRKEKGVEMELKTLNRVKQLTLWSFRLRMSSSSHPRMIHVKSTSHPWCSLEGV